MKKWRSVEHKIMRARSYVAELVCGLLACCFVGLLVACLGTIASASICIEYDFRVLLFLLDHRL